MSGRLPRGRWRIGAGLVVLAAAVRLLWVLAVPTIPVGDFATYRESAMYLAEHGHLDGGFIYMPGFVVLLAALHRLGGEVLADKLLGVLFGGLGAGAVYALTARLCDDRVGPLAAAPARGDAGATADAAADPAPAVPARSGRWLGDAPVALVAGLAFALWPAGIATASVVGTDMPAAVAIAAALALLAALGPSRPRAAALAFGALMGLAAYLRAVALPLALLGAAYWGAARAGARATLGRTALGVVATALVLLPWGVRNWQASGDFYLTDSHGGVTALMGNDPNTAGTYSRGLGLMFHELTGRTFLSEPHRQTDRAAYALVRRWIAYEPAFAAGMVALRLERLFAREHGLLYWPVYRRGVLPPAAQAWFDARWHPITALADGFYLLLLIGTAAGAAFAAAERRWSVLVPLAPAAALAAIYALFVAEPRYRLTTEVLLFPTAAFGWSRLGMAVRAAVARADASEPTPAARARRRGLIGTAAVLALLALAALAVVRGGAALRERHRWAATVAHVGGRAVPALWRHAGGAGGPSPVRGSPTGATLALAAGDPGPATAELQIDAGAAVAGELQLEASLEWRTDERADSVAEELALRIEDERARPLATAASGSTSVIAGARPDRQGILRLFVRLQRSSSGAGTAAAAAAVRISALRLRP